LRTEFGVDASVKWPNDVLINGRKAAGILTEMQSDQEFSRFSVMGVGINVNQSREEMEGLFRYPATSISIEAGYTVKRQKVLALFLNQFEQYYDRFLEEGLEVLMPEIESFSGLIGKTIIVVCGEREIRGTAKGLNPDGALLLIGEDGLEETVWAGDVSRVEGAV